MLRLVGWMALALVAALFVPLPSSAQGSSYREKEFGFRGSFGGGNSRVGVNFSSRKAEYKTTPLFIPIQAPPGYPGQVPYNGYSVPPPYSGYPSSPITITPPPPYNGGYPGPAYPGPQAQYGPSQAYPVPQPGYGDPSARFPAGAEPVGAIATPGLSPDAMLYLSHDIRTGLPYYCPETERFHDPGRPCERHNGLHNPPVYSWVWREEPNNRNFVPRWSIKCSDCGHACHDPSPVPGLQGPPCPYRAKALSELLRRGYRMMQPPPGQFGGYGPSPYAPNYGGSAYPGESGIARQPPTGRYPN